MTAPRKIILVFDDSPLVLAMTKSALEEAGYSVATAESLDAFEAHRAATAPDLILVDVQMPEAFGDDVASTLRGAHGVRTPIVLLSNIDELELALRADEAQVDGWISKRAGIPELIRRVRELLR
jgi:DNA-binding response OmpR family regulator